MGKFDYTIGICIVKITELHREKLVVYGEEAVGKACKERVALIWKKIDELRLAIKVLKKEDK